MPPGGSARTHKERNSLKLEHSAVSSPGKARPMRMNRPGKLNDADNQESTGSVNPAAFFSRPYWLSSCKFSTFAVRAAGFGQQRLGTIAARARKAGEHSAHLTGVAICVIEGVFWILGPSGQMRTQWRDRQRHALTKEVQHGNRPWQVQTSKAG